MILIVALIILNSMNKKFRALWVVYNLSRQIPLKAPHGNLQALAAADAECLEVSGLNQLVDPRA